MMDFDFSPHDKGALRKKTKKQSKQKKHPKQKNNNKNNNAQAHLCSRTLRTLSVLERKLDCMSSSRLNVTNLGPAASKFPFAGGWFKGNIIMHLYIYAQVSATPPPRPARGMWHMFWAYVACVVGLLVLVCRSFAVLCLPCCVH